MAFSCLSSAHACSLNRAETISSSSSSSSSRSRRSRSSRPRGLTRTHYAHGGVESEAAQRRVFSRLYTWMSPHRRTPPPPPHGPSSLICTHICSSCGLTPKNTHQRPTVVVLCGPHVQGAQGVSCGRHLANHEVEVILFLPNFLKMQESVSSELNLYSRTSGQQVASVKDLPASPVDLVINCLDCHENRLLREQSWYQSAADWANSNRAPVLSIDPAVEEQRHSIEAKWTLCLGLPLPLADTESRVYLCDIGIPKRVFQEVGISYYSPFGCKFVIPLHSA